jgi:hypothetical protein
VTGDHVQHEWRAPLDDLRTLRESLREEEQRVSYWRQLVQGRLDLVRTAYRRALHERIDACTAQLVDHYQRDPAQIVR